MSSYLSSASYNLQQAALAGLIGQIRIRTNGQSDVAGATTTHAPGVTQISVNQKLVDFLPQGAPKAIVYNGQPYALVQADADTLVYLPVGQSHGDKLVVQYTGRTASQTTGVQNHPQVVGYQQIQVGSQTVKVPVTRLVTINEKKIIKVPFEEQVAKSLLLTREVDGLDDTGVVGTLLTRGQATLADASKLFTQPDVAKFLTTGLLSEDNTATLKATKLTGDGVEKANDLFVAGDPQVGGKDNNYQPITVTPNDGFISMFQDGVDGDRSVRVNAHVEKINAQGNVAFTEYGFVLKDGIQKYTANLSGGQFFVTGPDGKMQNLQPGEEYVVGNASDPVGRFFYANRPGGANGQPELRLVFESYEKTSPQSVNDLVAQGVDRATAEKIRTKTEMTFAFRIPDGQGTLRAPAGIGKGDPLKTANFVKTYYDAHFYEADTQSINAITKVTKFRDQEVNVPRVVPKTEFKLVQKPIFKTVPKVINVPSTTQKPLYEVLIQQLKEQAPLKVRINLLALNALGVAQQQSSYSNLALLNALNAYASQASSSHGVTTEVQSNTSQNTDGLTELLAKVIQGLQNPSSITVDLQQELEQLLFTKTTSTPSTSDEAPSA